MIMELFAEDAEGEEEYGKCRKHPSSTRTGVCPVCLTNRLNLLCPDCAHLRPCACLHPSTSSSSSSSSSSSFSFSFSYPPLSKSGASVGSVARMSFLIESEPAFRRSRSAAFPFIRAAKSGEKSAGNLPPPPPPDTWNRSSSSASFWSFFKTAKTKRRTEDGKKSSATKKQMQMQRSRSVGFSCYSDPKKEISGRDVRLKVWGWRLPSPIKIFGYPKTMKVVHDRATLIKV